MRSRPSDRLWALLAILCCLAIGVSPIVGAAVGVAGSPANDLGSVPTVGTGTESDRIGGGMSQTNASGGTADNVLRLDVRANGSAAGTVVYRTRLDDANETAAFAELRTTIETNPQRYTASFAERMTAAAAAAEVATGREMTIEDVRVRASREFAGGGPAGRLGIVTYTFVWRGFAATDGERIQVGDALSGFFLDTETRLVLSWPDGYAATSIRPRPDERRPNAAIWAAPTDFGEGELGLVLTPVGASAGGTDGSTPSGDSGDRPPENGARALPSWVGIVALVSLAVLVVLVAARRRGVLAILGFGTAAEEGNGRSETTKTESESASSGIDTDGTPDDAADGDGERAVTSIDRSAATTPATETVDDPLLSNEERLLRLLDRREGRVKQRDVATELGWSAAKTSQVVRSLRRDGRVEGFRLGRENVLWSADSDDVADDGADSGGSGDGDGESREEGRSS